MNHSLLPLSLALSAGLVSADNWPQWRGPLATEAAPNANPPTTAVTAISIVSPKSNPSPLA